MLRADNDTRWNSTHNMIESALRQEDRIKTFVNSVDDLEKDKLSDLEWMELRKVKDLLAPFEQWTQYGQGRNSPQGSISTVLLGMDMLLSHLEKAKMENLLGSEPLKRAIEAAWSKLDYYYQLTDSAPVYGIAIVLDPRLKLDYFKRKWKADWIVELKRKLQREYEEYKKDSVTQESQTACTDVLSTLEHMENDNGAKIDINGWCFGNNVPTQNELDEYLSTPCVRSEERERGKEFNRIQWWIPNSTAYPVLARMAFDVLSIPAMSVECERVFSK